MIFCANYIQLLYFIVDVSDVERYDTTVTVPTNLKDGVYILQFASLVGNIQQPYYSCAKLTVTGGNPSLKCSSNKPPTIYKCFRSGGPPMDKITVRSTLFYAHDHTTIIMRCLRS